LKNDALWHLACRNEPPEGDEQLARERDDHGLALLALTDTFLEPLGGALSCW
jgi:hypothetical protein